MKFQNHTHKKQKAPVYGAFIALFVIPLGLAQRYYFYPIITEKIGN